MEITSDIFPKTKRDILSLIVRLLIIAAFLIVLISNGNIFYQAQDYSNAENGASQPIGLITAGSCYQQPLILNRDISSITSFSIRFATYGHLDYDKETARIEVSLEDENGTILFSEEVIVGTLKDNQFRTFMVDDQIRVPEGSLIYVTVRGIDTTEDNAPTIWLSGSTEQASSEMTYLEANRSADKTSKGCGGFFALAMDVAYLRIDRVLIIAGLFAVIIVLFLVKIKRNDKKYRFEPAVKTAVGLLAFLLSYLVVKRLSLDEYICNNIWNDILPFITFLLVFLIVSIIFSNVTIGLVFSQTIIFVLSVIENLKMDVRGDAFLPTDYFGAAAAAKIVSGNDYSLTLSYQVILTLLLLALISLLTFRGLRKMVIKPLFQLVITLSLAALLLTSFPFVHTNHDFLMNSLKIRNVNWNPNQNVADNGFFESFLMNSDVLIIKKPDLYSEKTVGNIISEASRNISEGSANVKKETQDITDPPNVIFIMDESFYDLRVLDDEFSDINIMPYFDSLKSDSISGELLVPVFAGGTCNTEFEVLTGFSDYFFPAGALPYQQYIHQEITALPAVLDSQGYRCVAVHPNDPTFWNRKVVYDFLGFNDFISSESFTDQNEFNRGMYSDKSVYDVILNEIKTHDDPEFVFAVTIQNHGPYSLVGNESVYDLHSDKYNNIELDNYMNLIRKSDEDLKYLIEDLKNLDEKTIVVFFGDHAPSLGNDFSSTFQDKALANYSTPYIIWANYDAGITAMHESMSSNYLSPFVLEQIGLKCDPWFSYLNLLRKDVPMISRIGIVDNHGVFYPNTGEYDFLEFSNLIDNYYTLQYDLLIKNNYFEAYYSDYY